MMEVKLQKMISILVAMTILLGVLTPVSQALGETSSVTESEKELESSLTQMDEWYIGPGETEYLNGSEKDEFELDESIVIDGGRLEINNASLTLLIDGYHPYNITLKNSGELQLWNSKINTYTESQLRPFLKTNISAFGGSTIEMKRASSFQFPGWVYLENSELRMENSSFDALEDIPDYDYTWGYSNIGEQDNSYCPTLTAASGSDVTLIDSEINDNYQAGLDSMEWEPSDWTGDYNMTDGGDIKLDGNEDQHLNITKWLLSNPQFPTPDGTDKYPYMNPFDKLSALLLELELNYDDAGTVDGNVYYGINGAEKQIFDINRAQNDYEENLFDLETFGSEIEDIGYDEDDFTKDLFVGINNTGSANITFDMSQQDMWSAFDNDMRLEDSTMTVINSYIDIDYLPADVDPRPTDSEATAPNTHRIDSNTDHRVIRVYDSELRAHGIEVEGEPTADGDPPFVEWGASMSDIYRWVDVEAFDSTGEPVEGAEILSDPGMDLDTGQYEEALAYLEENYEGEYLDNGTYRTGDEGKATMILKSDTLEFPGDWPNGNYSGSYTLEGSYDLDGQTHNASKQIGLDSFPDLSDSANNPQYTLQFDMEIPLPDLNIVNLTVDGKTVPDDLVINSTVEINLTFSNDGEKGANDIPVDFSLDNELIESSEITNIGPGEEKSYVFQWTPDEQDSGSRVLTGRVDPNDSIYEREKGDQEESMSLTINERPDLRVEAINLEGEYAEEDKVREGSQVDVTSTVSNMGGTGVEDVNLTLDLDGGEIDRQPVILGTNEQKEITFTWSVPQQLGNYQLSSEIDPEGAIDESDENNNIATQSVDVVSSSDVTISNFELITNDPVFVDDTVTIETSIENQGGWSSDSIEVTFYVDRNQDSEEQITLEVIDSIEAGGSESLEIFWTAEIPENIGQQKYDREISVAVREIGESEITLSESITIERETALMISGVSVDRQQATVGETVTITGEVVNQGGFTLEEYTISLFLGSDNIASSNYENLTVGDAREFEFEWEADLDQDEIEANRILHLEITETTPELTTDPAVVEESVLVRSRPDLQIEEYTLLRDGQEIDTEGGFELEEMDELTLEANVTNVGGTPIEGAVVEVTFPDGTVETQTIAVGVGENQQVSMNWMVEVTNTDIIIRVNSTVGDDATTYSEMILEDFEINAMTPELVEFSIPEDPQPGESYAFDGTLQRASDDKPLQGKEIIVRIENEDGDVVASTTATTNDEGYFTTTLQIPDEAGDYTVVYETQTAESTTFSNSMPVQTDSLEILGLPWWIFVVIAAIAVGGAGSIFAYTKFFGVGEMVECGNCGATISADATTCPKCGVEFDMDTVKCSECGEWIPADADECPECGAEFVKTGKEVQDYTERMREQYKKFVRQQKRKAEEELEKELSKQEFMDWWKDQPSFVTFEDWMERKEKQRREGSKECPECGSLNSVDAAVCQKCGTSLIDVDVVEEEEEEEREEKTSDELLEGEEEVEEEETEESEEEEESEERFEEETEETEEPEEEEEAGEGKAKEVKKKPKKKVKKKVVKKSSEDEE